jgi:hypothetical protein
MNGHCPKGFGYEGCLEGDGAVKNCRGCWAGKHGAKWAGFEKSEYPENVLLGSEDGGMLLRELKEIQESQALEIEYCMDTLTKCFGDQLSGIISGIQKGAMDGSPMQISHAFLLKKMAKLLDGEYFYDSYFYDTAKYTARLDESTMREIQEKPQDWALVFFDHHF